MFYRPIRILSHLLLVRINHMAPVDHKDLVHFQINLNWKFSAPECNLKEFQHLFNISLNWNFSIPVHSYTCARQMYNNSCAVGSSFNTRWSFSVRVCVCVLGWEIAWMLSVNLLVAYLGYGRWDISPLEGGAKMLFSSTQRRKRGS